MMESLAETETTESPSLPVPHWPDPQLNFKSYRLVLSRVAPLHINMHCWYGGWYLHG